MSALPGCLLVAKPFQTPNPLNSAQKQRNPKPETLQLCRGGGGGRLLGAVLRGGSLGSWVSGLGFLRAAVLGLCDVTFWHAVDADVEAACLLGGSWVVKTGLGMSVPVSGVEL